MSGANVTVAQLPTKTTMASGDSVWAWSATGQNTYQAFPSQIVPAGFGTLGTATSATAGVASLPSGPVGFFVVSISGVAVKLPYYST